MCSYSGGSDSISTHAPAGGATGADFVPVEAFDISTHAPAGGATHIRDLQEGRTALISTHAPAGGATGPGLRRRLPGSYFYSRPCGRGDRSVEAGLDADTDFYSRPCGRGDVA